MLKRFDPFIRPKQSLGLVESKSKTSGCARRYLLPRIFMISYKSWLYTAIIRRS